MSKILLELDNTADYAPLSEWCIICCDFLVKTYPKMSEFVHEVKHAIMKIDNKQSIRQNKKYVQGSKLVNSR